MSDWRTRALCANGNYDPEWWFTGDRDRAKRVCARCPVVEHCAAEAQAWFATDGVWAGQEQTRTPPPVPPDEDEPQEKVVRPRGPRPKDSPVTQRHAAIAALHAEGFADGQIAERLRLHKKTVRRWRSLQGLAANINESNKSANRNPRTKANGYFY